jgi:hypothetical protein
MPDELRPHVRDEPVPDDATVVVRGGPDSLDKLPQHATRTNRAYQLDAEPLWGVSVFLALDATGDASLDGILGGRMSSYRIVHTSTAARVRAAGFDFLPTFRRPHYTLVLPDTSQGTVEMLVAALGPGAPNPYHVARRRR